MATSDAAAQGLAACQAGPAFGAARYDWIVPAGLPVGAAVGQVQATDPGGGAVSFALTAGNDAGAFQLNATTGILSVAGDAAGRRRGVDGHGHRQPGPRVERAGSGGGGGRGPAAGAAGVPGGGLELPGGGGRAGGHGRLGRPRPCDLDSGPLTYALTAGNTGDVFALDASSGMLTVAGALDHETAASYTLTLTATDAHGGTATATVAISVTDVAHAPRFAAAPLYVHAGRCRGRRHGGGRRAGD